MDVPNAQEKIEAPNAEYIWTLELDGTYVLVGYGAIMVLVCLVGRMIHLACKLDFKNTNYTTKYETILLVIVAGTQKN